MKATILFFVCMVCATGPLCFAQEQAVVTEKKWSLQVEGGISIPLGDFASTTSAQAGGAKTGFSIGADFSLLAGKGFSWLTTFFFSSNSVSDDLAKSLSGASSYTGDLGSWKTVWPLTGIRYAGEVSPTIGLYGMGQIGILFGSSPNASIRSGSTTYSSKSTSASSFAYGFGGGILIKNRFNIGFRYIGAQPTYDFEFKATGPGFTSTTTGKSDQPTSLLQFTVGVNF